jgi:hypothetical protein
MNPLAPCAVIAVLGASACQATAATSSPQPDARTLAVTRLDVYAQVARRIYSEERTGFEVHSSLKRISRDAAAMSGSRAELLRQLYLPHYHVVRLRWARGGRVVDVGGRFVVAGATRGPLTISMQDVIGYVKLIHRQTGRPVVVRGRAGQVVASPASLAKATLPSSGVVTVGARTYLVKEFSEPGFAGDTLHVWMLGPPD